MPREKRKDKRSKHRDFMRVTDNETHELLGYLSEISRRGFKLETPKVLAVKKDYSLRLEYASEVEDNPYIVFVARAKWSHPDPITPDEYIAGFQIVRISPSEQEIFQGIVEKYGSTKHNW